ncbi:hypothetical protein WMF04_09760 [Sorangium sp. So ce260]|uniref:hypothetical protein n=1 Tax=Sorangium sp. So ce260 TaxID=3133291 RepID=UPI003F615DF5
MRNRIVLAISFLGLLSVCLPACIREGEPLEEESETAAQEVFTKNAFTKNALKASALTTDRLATEALTGNPLTSAAIAGSPDVLSALRDPMAREFLTYVAGCALPEGESVEVSLDGETYVFEGDVGLSPEWGRAHGQCNARCQGWVSACMLARVNHLGESLPISMRGQNNALDLGPDERESFPHREGAYFGDLFAPEQLRFACRSPGSTLIRRVCGGTGVDTPDCIVDVLGECDEVCGPLESDGSFRNCVGGGHTIPTTVTIFRQ